MNKKLFFSSYFLKIYYNDNVKTLVLRACNLFNSLKPEYNGVMSHKSHLYFQICTYLINYLELWNKNTPWICKETEKILKKTNSIAHINGREEIVNRQLNWAKKLKKNFLQSLLFRGLLLWTICTFRIPSIFAQYWFRCSRKK